MIGAVVGGQRVVHTAGAKGAVSGSKAGLLIGRGYIAAHLGGLSGICAQIIIMARLIATIIGSVIVLRSCTSIIGECAIVGVHLIGAGLVIAHLALGLSLTLSIYRINRAGRLKAFLKSFVLGVHILIAGKRSGR